MLPVYVNTNEDGKEYGFHDNVNDALNMLFQYPNDHIVIRLVTPAYLRYVRDTDYSLDMALLDGMTDIEYRRVLENRYGD